MGRFEICGSGRDLKRANNLSIKTSPVFPHLLPSTRLFDDNGCVAFRWKMRELTRENGPKHKRGYVSLHVVSISMFIFTVVTIVGRELTRANDP